MIHIEKKNGLKENMLLLLSILKSRKFPNAKLLSTYLLIIDYNSKIILYSYYYFAVFQISLTERIVIFNYKQIRLKQ